MQVLEHAGDVNVVEDEGGAPFRRADVRVVVRWLFTAGERGERGGGDKAQHDGIVSNFVTTDNHPRPADPLSVNGFPDALLYTTTGIVVAFGDQATAFKCKLLKRVVTDRGYRPAYAFGNTASDAAAYESIDIQPVEHRMFFAFDDQAFGGRRCEQGGPTGVEVR
jgi:hypothetical protein